MMAEKKCFIQQFVPVLKMLFEKGQDLRTSIEAKCVDCLFLTTVLQLGC